MTGVATIPMLDLTRQYHALSAELAPALLAVLERGQYILGPELQAFEDEVAAHLGVAHAVGCASGTDALLLALRVLDIGPGHEVVSSAFTFVATAEAIVLAGARPVFADVSPSTGNLDPAAVEAVLSPATRALLPVHLFGCPADMGALGELASRHGLALIEDAAQAFGATWQGRSCGGLGDAGAFSFFPSKNLGACGDGGLVTTGSPATAERLRLLRNHGSRERYLHEAVGYNSRLDELQAALLRVKLRHLPAYNAARRQVAAWYRERLADLAELTLPAESTEGQHIYHQFTVQSDRRDHLQRALSQAGIASVVYYQRPLHQQPVFAGLALRAALPVTESLAGRCLSLPMFPELSEAEVDRVCACVRRALGRT